jgi:mono/diheme cytochrome c family protein
VLLSLVTLVAIAQAPGSVWDGVYTPQQANRGEALYSMQCAACHGSELTGGESAPPLMGGEFLSSWYGLTVGDLFDRIRVSMPADRPGTLSREKAADILSHIFRVNGFPAGKTDLATQSEYLKQIRIEAKPDRKN